VDRAVVEPSELNTLITDLEERISEVRLSSPSEQLPFSSGDCSVLGCSVLAFCGDDDGGSGS
jgi:hypothetical protein